MHHPKHPSLAELCNGDLQSKMMEGDCTRDLKEANCNCGSDSSINNHCPCNGICGKHGMTHSVIDAVANSIHFGNTQQKCKKRMTRHNNKVSTFIERDKSADSYARHIAKTLTSNPTTEKQK